MLLFIKKFYLLLILFLIYTILAAFSYSNAVCNNIEKSVFRLHVVANSNTSEDQSLKYLVRDNVLAYINSISTAKSKEAVECLISNNLEEIQVIAQNTIIENGYNYSINLSVGNFSFPTKKYGDITFPAGNYDALKIEIGNAKGENWWCVMFPPLCFVDLNSAGIVPYESKKVLETSLSEDEYALISTNSTQIDFKFKIVEFLHQLSI